MFFSQSLHLYLKCFVAFVPPLKDTLTKGHLSNKYGIIWQNGHPIRGGTTVSIYQVHVYSLLTYKFYMLVVYFLFF